MAQDTAQREVNEEQFMAAFAELTAAVAEFEEASHVGDALRLAAARPRLEAAARSLVGDAHYLCSLLEHRHKAKSVA